jgi:thioredoxin-like negative regulator of GroEL
VVFLSCDGTDTDMSSYFASMPWLAVRFDDDERESLTARFQVSSIPRLVVVSAAGSVLAQNAVGLTIEQLRGWCKPAVHKPAAAATSSTTAAAVKGGCCGGHC